MQIIDITQELFHCAVFPGDPVPEMTRSLSLERGDVCNLTAFSMCAHNGTHVDAPFHFIDGGKTVDRMGLVPYVGDCWVARHSGDVTVDDARRMRCWRASGWTAWPKADTFSAPPRSTWAAATARPAGRI